jgi:hypothetical protein
MSRVKTVLAIQASNINQHKNKKMEVLTCNAKIYFKLVCIGLPLDFPTLTVHTVT